ncbi:MAG: FkbM family methyltransferase [Rickettsiaceae bacterium]|nr:FkbM family methyltransferase [Rickettsiaceae bacterium]
MTRKNLLDRVLNKFNTFYLKRRRLMYARRIGLNYQKPNFIYFPNRLKESVIVIDAGCSYEADFSKYMIKNYSVTSFAVDPTLKHQNALKKLESILEPRFKYLQCALGPKDERVLFYESKTNESGSLLNRHVNVQNDEHISYYVDVYNLNTLRSKIGAEDIEILKLDLEGAEYQLIDSLRKEDIESYKQIFVEFHHHAIDMYSFNDTIKCVDKMKSFGFENFTLDNHNYLFYKK